MAGLKSGIPHSLYAERKSGILHWIWRATLLVAVVAVASCSRNSEMAGGYRQGLEPGISRAQAESIMGKPTLAEKFSLPGISADVLTYPFGELLVQHDKVVAVTVASDPNYVGPLGMKVGTSEDDLRKALLAAPGQHSSYRDDYQVTSGDIETRTRDVYDSADHVLFELAAANPNDSEAPFSVISITLGDTEGLGLMSSITKAKVQGLYPGQHVFNFVSEPWPTKKGL